MDASIIANTRKYAKPNMLKRIMNPINVDKLKMVPIYALDTINDDTSSWRAVLVDSFCQAGKTKKCFEILNTKMKSETGNTLVLYVTQANSKASVTQTIQRAKESTIINEVIPPTNIYKSTEAPDDGLTPDNYMIVDFWHSKNMANMIEVVRENIDILSTIIIVVDECEQGHTKGLKERLSFIRKIEKNAPDCVVKVIFITATVPNLSKSILCIAKDNLVKFKTGVVFEIVNNQVVEHQFAEPHESYVGASWFKETPGVWNRLVMPKKTAEMTKDDHFNLKMQRIMKLVKALPNDAKELTLFVTSTRTCDHASLRDRLMKCGYNVTVEMNGTNNKNFKIGYINSSGEYSTWTLPFSQIDSKADRGDLETYMGSKKKWINSGIHGKDDYTMAHILQSALFMATDAEERIKKHSKVYDLKKLEAINNAIMNLDSSHRRPADFPECPRVALIAGHLAGRGVTFQNPDIDFTCTSFCFTDSLNVAQRGATNTQRFGRACGMLMDVFARQDRTPILIATEGIMKDAIANEAALREKADQITNGSLISLKDMISEAEWKMIEKQTEKVMDTVTKEKTRTKVENEHFIDGVSLSDLKRWLNDKTLVGKMIRFLYKQQGMVTFAQFKEGVRYNNSDDAFESNLKNGMSVKSSYGKLWRYTNGTIELNVNIRHALNTILTTNK